MRDVIHCLRGTDFCPSHPFRGTIWGQKYEKNMKTGRKYGEKEKIQILIKSLIYRILRICIFSFYAFLFFVSFADAKMLVICMSVSWVVLEWYLSHDFIVGNRSLSSCKSVYYVLYKCCFLLFSQVTYQYTFVIWLIVR